MKVRFAPDRVHVSFPFTLLSQVPQSLRNVLVFYSHVTTIGSEANSFEIDATAWEVLYPAIAAVWRPSFPFVSIN